MKIPPVKPYFPRNDIEAIKRYISEILTSGMLSSSKGKYLLKFEKKFAELCQVKHAIAVNSGTSALEITIRSLSIVRKEIIVPTNTFSASVSSVLHADARPVLTDINPKTLCVDSTNVLKKITNKTSAVMVVHIGGIVCSEIEVIKEICNNHHLYLIEDCAHAHGSTINNRFAGSFGDVGCFSFYPTKVMTTGEGGMIVTDNLMLSEEAMCLRDQGRKLGGGEEYVRLGYNWRMSEITACLGLGQLMRLPEILSKRATIAKFYDTELTKINGIKPLQIPNNISSNYYKYITFLDDNIDRDIIKKKLYEKGVICGGEVYDPPIHLQPIYRKLLKTKEGDFPIAEKLSKRMLCLPLYTSMSREEMLFVVKTLQEVFN